MQAHRPIKIYLFTDRYPYGRGETFVENELHSLPSGQAIDITVIPARRAATRRDLPQGIGLSDRLNDASFATKAGAMLRSLTSAHLWRLPFSARRPKNLRQWRNALGGLYRAYLTFLTLSKHRHDLSDARVLYAYWLDNTATGLAMAKSSLPPFRDTVLVSRAHGYDVFEQQRGVFFPARDFTLEHIDRIFPVSQAGTDYLKQRYPDYADKMECRHLGVDNGPEDTPALLGQENALRIVSCANVIALKRIGSALEMLIRYARMHLERTIRWTHFGDGPLLEDLRKKSREVSLPNLHIDFAGAQANRLILERYARGDFDVFLSLSLSEGMPVSAIEAMSCGIVPVCTDAGGTRDAVDEDCGALLALDFDYADFEKALERVWQHYPALSRAAREKQRRDFCARTNYEAFYRYLASVARKSAGHSSDHI